jgi:predicted unusual protein kinase regulating ubiquinone biosynthesis (AarF/ABC1/UbiB family)
VKSDIKALGRMLRFANALPSDGDFDEVFAQIEAIFLQEIDFAHEADEYERFGGHFAAEPTVVVPRVVRDLSTRLVLVTEWVEGVNVDAWLSTPAADANTAEGKRARGALTANILRVLFQEIFALGRVQSDPNPANFLVTPEGRLALLDFGATQVVEPNLLEGYRDLSRACLYGTKADVLRVSDRMGFLLPRDSAAARDAFARMLAIATEPFLREEYDFGRAGLVSRMRDVGFTFVKETGVRPPPPGIVFLNRRIVGTQMLLERVGGVTDVRSLLLPHLT